MNLTAQDVAGAIAELSRAVAQLAQEADVPSARRTSLSDTESLEVERICLTHSKMLRAPGSSFPDLGSGSYEEEVIRLTAMNTAAARPFRGDRSGRSGQTLALSRTITSPAAGQLMSKYGLPITVGGRPVADTPANRVAFGRVLPPMVVDSDDPSTVDVDVVSTLRSRGGGLGDGYDQPPDLGPDVSGFGKQTMEVSNPGAVADPAAEVSRLVQAGAAAGVQGLQAGVTKGAARHPQTGRFVPKARLSGTLSGPV